MRFKTIITVFLFGIFFISDISGRDNNEINICTTDYLNIRVEPDLKSKPLMSAVRINEKRQLRIGDTVRVLKRTEREETVNGVKGRWAYVDPGYSDKTCGWVFDYYLAKKEDFKLLKLLPNNYVLNFTDGDAPFEYEFYKDGIAIYKAIDEGEIDQKGKLYIDSRGRVLTIKYDNEELELMMMMRTFYLKDGEICVVGGGDLGDACAVVKK
ncbi:MAG: hypothetical protein CVV49_21640 [Spirochaetae bacterium HGW-Spirochaetae-5]|nr:MAG: hypothetical protein CVV49_21640 [Spirochaetae bacterium HGW-Spirochaetae-5]